MSRKLIAMTVMTGAVSFIPVSPVHAADCLIQNFKDLKSYSSNEAIKYAYYDRYIRNTEKSDNTSFGIEFFDIVGLNFAQASRMNEWVNRTLQLNLDYTKSERLLISQLTDNDLEAYRACLKVKEPVEFSLSNDAFLQDHYTFVVKYHPESGTRPIKIMVATDNGTIEGHKSTTKSSVVNSDTLFQIENRSILERTNLVISYGTPGDSNKVLQFYLPPAPRSKIVKVIQQGSPVRGWHQLVTYVQVPLKSCVTAKDDNEIIVPKTVRTNWISGPNGYKADFIHKVDKDDYQEACVVELPHYLAIGDNESLSGDFRAEAQMLRSVPIQYTVIDKATNKPMIAKPKAVAR